MPACSPWLGISRQQLTARVQEGLGGHHHFKTAQPDCSTPAAATLRFPTFFAVLHACLPPMPVNGWQCMLMTNAALHLLLFLLPQELRVSDFALVPFAAVRLAPGLNAISGQSGAGKSVLIDALAQLLGAPAQADCVRPPADTAVVEGTWWCGPGVAAAAAELLAEMGLPSKALPGVWGAAAGATAGGGVIHIRREVGICVLASALLTVKKECGAVYNTQGSVCVTCCRVLA